MTLVFAKVPLLPNSQDFSFYRACLSYLIYWAHVINVCKCKTQMVTDIPGLGLLDDAIWLLASCKAVAFPDEDLLHSISSYAIVQMNAYESTPIAIASNGCQHKHPCLDHSIPFWTKLPESSLKDKAHAQSPDMPYWNNRSATTAYLSGYLWFW